MSSPALGQGTPGTLRSRYGLSYDEPNKIRTGNAELKGRQMRVEASGIQQRHRFGALL